MKSEPNTSPSHVLFIPHGGGPLPLLGDKSHQQLIDFLQALAPSLGKPSAILVFSAHWEEQKVTVTSGDNPGLEYDYYGFPQEAYQIQYPAPGDPTLANKIFQLLQRNGIDARLDSQRGFDHGLFVPLKLLFPEANIPCVQVSLLNNLDPAAHIQIGKALSILRQDNILIIGSGFSFHNLKAFFAPQPDSIDPKNAAFETWLIDSLTNNALTTEQRQARLIRWRDAPYADYCHPRAEHLLPLHVCLGMTDSPAQCVFDGEILGKKASAFLW